VITTHQQFPIKLILILASVFPCRWSTTHLCLLLLLPHPPLLSACLFVRASRFVSEWFPARSTLSTSSQWSSCTPGTSIQTQLVMAAIHASRFPMTSSPGSLVFVFSFCFLLAHFNIVVASC
jgi:hypothetical protein